MPPSTQVETGAALKLAKVKSNFKTENSIIQIAITFWNNDDWFFSSIFCKLCIFLELLVQLYRYRQMHKSVSIWAIIDMNEYDTFLKDLIFGFLSVMAIKSTT